MGGRGSSSGGSGSASSINRNMESIRNAASNMPKIKATAELTGTPKQVSWAKDIRERMVDRLNDSAERETSSSLKRAEIGARNALSSKMRNGKEKSPEQIKKSRDKFNETSRDVKAGMKSRAETIKNVQDAVNSHTSAKWWIDNRNNMSLSTFGVKMVGPALIRTPQWA